MRKQLIVALIVVSIFMFFQNLSGAGFEAVIMESNDYILREDGGFILLETATQESPSQLRNRLMNLGFGLRL